MRKAVPTLVDLVVVVVFAAVGRVSHHENVLVGLAHTAWPFLVACLVAWGVLLWSGLPSQSWRGFLVVWPITAIGGLLLRVATGTSAQWSFWIVATIFLGIFLGVWRLGVHLVERRRLAHPGV